MKTTLTKDDPAGWYLCSHKPEWTHEKALRKWTGNCLECQSGMPSDQGQYVSFEKLYTDDDVEALRQDATVWRTLNDFSNDCVESLSNEVERLMKELKALKASPYPMRKADKPDCVGLWMNSHGVTYTVKERDLAERNTWCYRPYYYLGPIPVIPAEQKPPQVVTVRNKKSGQVFRAIPSTCGSSLAVLNDDGSFRGNEMVINWGVVK